MDIETPIKKDIEESPVMNTSEKEDTSNIGLFDPLPTNLKYEDIADGMIRCPSCKQGLYVTDGCTLMKCRKEHANGE